MNQKGFWTPLLHPSPNLLLAFILVSVVLIIFLSATGATLLTLFLPEGKEDPSPILWHICTTATGAFIGLMAGVRIQPQAVG